MPYKPQIKGLDYYQIGGGSGSLIAGLNLSPTAVKTSDYNAVAGELIPTDTTAGNVVVTLPNTPADKTTVAVKMVILGGSNTTIITTSGSGVFNKTGGGTTATLSLLNQAMLLQYKASGDIWYVIADDLSLSQLDLRFAPINSPTFTGTPLAPTAAAHTNTTQIATTAFVESEITNAIAGVNPAVAVLASTTAAGETNGFTYNNGSSGIGATLTGTINVGFTTDTSVTFTTVGQRLLDKNNSTPANRGIYVLTQVQTALLPPVFTRATDFDESSSINNTGAIPIISGTLHTKEQYVLTSTVNTVGTDGFTFTKFSANPDSKKNVVEGIIASGTNTYTATYSPTPTAYVSGMPVLVTFTNGNTGASTLNLNSLGAIPIVKGISTAVASGDIPVGTSLWLLYNGTNFVIINSNIVNGFADWSPSFTGFSTNPTGFAARYSILDKLCSFYYQASTTGVSDAATFTFTLPFVAAKQQILTCLVRNNGTISQGTMRTQTGTNIADIFVSPLGTFTSSGNKDLFITGAFETV